MLLKQQECLKENNHMQSNWFKDAIVYQIYPQSFKDSNNDGIGDLQGIISKIDYLKSLGINCIWLSPIYVSPLKDNGYDISDYRNINPLYGTMNDFKELVNKLHKNDIRLIMDFVGNHTSSEHEWFKKSKDKKSIYHDYYFWKDKPNNWTGFFGEKAWSYDEDNQKYYLHLFAKSQPDVNWDNPKVRKEYKDILKYWLDLGVDGFRCDVINLISKDTSFKNGKNLLILKGKKYFINGPHLHEYLKELNEEVFSLYDCMTVGETVFTSIEDVKMLTANDRKELSMVFNFEHTNVDNYLGVKWLLRKFSLKRFKKTIDKYQYGLASIGWNSLFIENHDQRRSVGRFNTSDTIYRKESAKMLATTMFLLKGTPYIYQGQEIGMTNLNVNSIEEFKDIETKNVINTMCSLHLPKKYINKTIRNGSRDNARTPMQWDDSINAGFSNSTPWLKVNNNYKEINVEKEINNQDSIFHYYQQLIKLHKELDIVKNGIYKDLLPKSKNIFAYERKLNNETLLIISSFTSKKINCNLLDNYPNYKTKLLLNNYSDDEKFLLPYQCKVYLLTKTNE